MQLAAKIKNKSLTWTTTLRPRVGTVASDGTDYYYNISGVNAALTDTTNWFKLTNNGASSGGNTILSGTTDPASGTGNNGDFYINTTSHAIFGPKASGAWPSGTSMVGPTGATGANGTNGNTVLSGTVDPASGTGNNGDYYINTTSHTIFGPKASGAWPGGVALVGPTGAAGTNGNTVLNGITDPSSGTGNNGDFYINTTSNKIFGPKASGAWPSGVSIVGPTGATGATGPGVPTGGTAAQVLSKIDGTNYNTQWMTPSGGGTWGSITGSLSSQSDLQNALNYKQSIFGWILNQQIFSSSGISANFAITHPNASFTFSSSGLVISGGAGATSFADHADLLNYSQLEDYQIETSTFVNTTSGVGLGLGIDCPGGAVAICKADLSGTSGKIYISTNGSTFGISSASALTYSSTDLLQIILRRNKFAVYAYFLNVTTGQVVVATYDISATACTYVGGANVNRNGRPAIWAFGGTQTFSNSGYIIYRTFSPQNPTLAFVGDSWEVGYASGDIQKRWVALNGQATFPYSVLAAASATTADIVNMLPELGLVNPNYAVFTIGVNDAINSISTTITQANITTINNYCISHGVKTIWCTVSPTSNATYNTTIVSNNAFITTMASDNKSGVTLLIDFYTLMASGGVLNSTYDAGDGIHPNLAGHNALATYFVAQTKGLLAYNALGQNDSRYILNTVNTGHSYGIGSIELKVDPSGYGIALQDNTIATTITRVLANSINFYRSGGIVNSIVGNSGNLTINGYGGINLINSNGGAALGGWGSSGDYTGGSGANSFLSGQYRTTQTGIGTNQIDGFVAVTGTNASAGTPVENAPAFTAIAKAWDSGASASKELDLRMILEVVSGTPVTGSFNFYFQLASGGYSKVAGISSGGILALPNSSIQTTLVAGTKALSITGVTTSSKAFVSLATQGGTVTTTVQYEAKCTAGTITINAVTNAGSDTLNTLDTSTVNVFVIN
jgi:lysophospholipase L1-like esterase